MSWLKKKHWLVTYHRTPYEDETPNEDEGFWWAEFEGLDMEDDPFSVTVMTIDENDYDATINTEGTTYIKLGSIEMKNLTKCLKKAHKELLWLERES